MDKEETQQDDERKQPARPPPATPVLIHVRKSVYETTLENLNQPDSSDGSNKGSFFTKLLLTRASTSSTNQQSFSNDTSLPILQLGHDRDGKCFITFSTIYDL